MKNEGSKLYNRAMKHYSNGNLEKALDVCEIGMSLGLSNAALINLKGLLLYIEGDYEGAKATWKICKDFNDDETAKKYLISLEEDSNKLEMYVQANSLFNKTKIKEALEILEECRESDFNFINVNILIAKCYLKLGEQDKAKFHLIKVAEKDRNNEELKELKKQIADFPEEKPKVTQKQKIAIGASLVVVLAIVVLIKPISSMIKGKDNTSSDITINESAEQKENDAKIDELVKKELTVKNWDDLKSYISSKDYEKIGEFIKDVDKNTLDTNQKKLYSQSKELLDLEGVKHFYDKGNTLFKSKDFGNAIKEYEKAYSISEGNYLRPHVAYMIASCYEKLEEYDKAIEQYKYYLNEFADGEYRAEVTYKLAMINKDINKEESKKYAQIIKDTYSNSMYNNSNIKEILGQ